MEAESSKKQFLYTVASVDRAIELLFVLESASRDMGITELSKILGVQKSTVHNLVQTLMARDFVRQTDSGRFTLGFRLVRLGAAAADRLDLRRLAEPILRVIGKNGAAILERVTGMVLAALAIELIMEGLGVARWIKAV